MTIHEHSCRPAVAWWVLAGLVACAAALAPARSCGVTVEPVLPSLGLEDGAPRGGASETKAREEMRERWGELLDEMLRRQGLLPPATASPDAGTDAMRSDVLRAATSGGAVEATAPELDGSSPDGARLLGSIMGLQEPQAAHRAEAAGAKAAPGTRLLTSADAAEGQAAEPARLPRWLLIVVGAAGAALAVAFAAAWRHERAEAASRA